MDLYILMALCRIYADMGAAVQRQLDAILDGEKWSKQNPNALKMIVEFLDEADGAGIEDAQRLSEQIKEYLDAA